MEVDGKLWAATLSRAEKRALKLAFDRSAQMPDFPETISIGYACGPRGACPRRRWKSSATRGS